MDFSWLGYIVGGGGISGLIGVLITNRAARQKRVSDSVAQTFADTVALEKLIDERVQRKTGPLENELKEVREELKKLQARELSTKSILRRFFQKLRDWDREGRPGGVPMPSSDDMRELDLEDLQIAP